MVDIRQLCSGRSLARFLGARFPRGILKNKKPAQVILAGFSQVLLFGASVQPIRMLLAE
jgi:hypothetical protein